MASGDVIRVAGEDPYGLEQLVDWNLAFDLCVAGIRELRQRDPVASTRAVLLMQEFGAGAGTATIGLEVDPDGAARLSVGGAGLWAGRLDDIRRRPPPA